MAFADTGLNKVIVQGWFPCKVTLARACKVGDVIGVAEDSFDDLGPVNANESGHATTVTYLPRFVAGETGEAAEIITAYAIAVVQGTGLTGGFDSECMAKLYCQGAGLTSVAANAASTKAGRVLGTEATMAGSCTSVVGIQLDTDRILLFPGFRAPTDLVATA